ncbi:uncharacterized protein C8A04DRAFT_13297 [Dichotomopilus funicola]|uniref:Uncharacterized protein n=1 Tax=Dichotomopilus funicola TaxID=1934379 RepID=A0AAN6V083_9PEZI|nr:hypothetical protein C8A04DRAFT_13297 [Dichotomopilus funicola]
MSFSKHYRPIEAQLDGGQAMPSAALRLITRWPFPNGVIPPAMRSRFLTASTSDQADKMANAFANGPAIDSLVILIRLLLSLRLDLGLATDQRLYMLALHDFGRRLGDDYIVKGELFEILYPRQASSLDRVDMTLGELVYHPMVSKVLWSLQPFQFFRRETWAKRDAKAPVEPYRLRTREAFLPTPIRVPDQHHDINLARFFSQKLGPHHAAGGRIVYFAYQAPDVIPVIIRGGQPFDSIRTFTISGPSRFQPADKGTVRIVSQDWSYRLRAVLNLVDSDIHLYHHDTSPVVEQLENEKTGGDKIPRKGNSEKSCHTYKTRRSQHAPGWTFEDSPLREFLLIYEIHTDDKGSHKIRNKYGEYLPATRGDGM